MSFVSEANLRDTSKFTAARGDYASQLAPNTVPLIPAVPVSSLLRNSLLLTKAQ